MVFYLWAGLLGVILGRLIDRCSPRLILAVGGVSFALFGHYGAPHRWAAGVFALEAVGLLLSALGSAAWVLIAGSIIFGLPMMLVVSLLPVTAGVECVQWGWPRPASRMWPWKARVSIGSPSTTS